MTLSSLVRSPQAPLRPVGAQTGYLRARRAGATVSAKATGATVDAPADAIALLKKAAKDPSVNKKSVFKALREVQKAKLQESGWNKIIGSNQFWRLVYTADKDSVQKSLKDDEAGTGSYFPLTAAQKFDIKEGTFQNGVYLAPFGKLELGGPITMQDGQKKLEFNVTEVEVKLGPVRLGPFSLGGAKDGKLPFFVFFYADSDIICAQGKSGGIAMWAKAEGDFLLKNGIA